MKAVVMRSQSTFSVANLLKLHSMQNAEILAGKEGTNRFIGKLNVVEVPDIINWVSEGDFLLTAGYPFKDSPEALYEFIKQSIQKNLAGVGIKINRYINVIPTKILELADDKNFPIIKLPYEHSFSDILIEGFSEIVNVHSKTLLRVEDIQNKLIDVMLKGGTLTDIAKILHEYFYSNSMSIVDSVFDNSTILSEENYQDHIKQVIEKEKKAVNSSQNKNHRVRRIYDTWDDYTISRVEIPIYYEDTEYGKIYIWEDKKILTPLEIGMIESSTSLIALDIYKNLSMKETESIRTLEFIENLFSRDPIRFAQAMSRAQYFKFEPYLDYSVILISFKEQRSIPYNTLSNANYLQRKKENNLKIIHRLIKLNPNNITGTTKNDGIIFLFGVANGTPVSQQRKEIQSFCQNIETCLTEELQENDFIITVGRNYSKPENLWKSYDQATRTVEVSQLNLSGRIIFYEDIGIYKLLTSPELDAEREAFYQEELGPLIEYDRLKGSEFVNTLNQYFLCSSNYVKLAKALFIHYNTAVYRMQRIMSILNKDLESYQDRLTLELAMNIYRLYHKES